jgi:hypothetical protein
VTRRVSARGDIMIGGQRIQVGLAHARKTAATAWKQTPTRSPSNPASPSPRQLGKASRAGVRLQQVAGSGNPPSALRCTRLAALVNTTDPKLVAVAFGMNPEGVMFYLADYVDDSRLPAGAGTRRTQ